MKEKIRAFNLTVGFLKFISNNFKLVWKEIFMRFPTFFNYAFVTSSGY